MQVSTDRTMDERLRTDQFDSVEQIVDDLLDFIGPLTQLFLDLRT